MSETKKSKSTNILLSFICILLVGSLALSGFTVYNQMQQGKKLDQYMGTVEDINQEDDVMIASTYMIKSTLPISDAYKTGDTSKLDDTQKETLDMASAILKDIIKKDMTDYEKEKAVYTWLTSKLTSTTGILTVVTATEHENDNPHDVLKYHSAVCVGYATTFRMFMQMLGIECMVVHSSDLGHSWDLVKMDDGCWYHTDCYSDSDTNSFMNFNMDDALCSQSHDWNREFFPKAEGKKYNYILSVCKEIKNIYAIPEFLLKAIDKKKGAVSCTFKEEITEKTETAASTMVDTLIGQLPTDNYSVSYQWMLDSDGKYVLCFYIMSYNNSTAPELDEKTMEKINNAISKAMDKYVYSNPDNNVYNGAVG